MAANINDKFTQGTNGTRPVPDTLTAIKAIGAASISCGALTGWPTATAVHFSIYNIDTSGNKVANSQTDWKGVVSGTTITNLTLMAGTDNGYAVGAIVEAGPTAMWAKDMADGMIAEHDQDGTHSDITATSVTATSGTFTSLTVTGTATSQGWTPLGDVPDTVTYNGNRNYDIVMNGVDHTSTLSPGMKLQLTRTVAAPDQCADLEASSSQYFSKSSPAGMTFTDDFTCMAWIKLESYTTGVIVQRYAATNGFQFYIESDGTININGTNAGNADLVKSYAAVPLNKWVHVAATLNMSAATATIYIDGVLVSNSYTNGSATALVQSGDLSVGRNQAGSAYFDGKLAQVAIFSSVLTDTTIRSYMSQGLTGSESTLVSAYSFDNSLNDLNTTNANNLSAGGGAVATNADSPFANAVSAGLLEYAEINAVTFSTNTTVNVRVPETCMIPTSGGVSAVSYSTQSNPYGLPYFSSVLGYWELNSDVSTSGTGDNEVYALATTVYIPAGGSVMVSAAPIIQSNGSANTYVGLWDGAVGGTLLVDSIQGINGLNQMLIQKRVTATSAGTKTFRLSIKTSTGSASVRGTAAPVSGTTLGPSTIKVELV